MAAQCPECDNTVAYNAEKCPNCGWITPSARIVLVINTLIKAAIVFGLIIVFVYACAPRL